MNYMNINLCKIQQEFLQIKRVVKVHNKEVHLTIKQPRIKNVQTKPRQNIQV